MSVLLRSIIILAAVLRAAALGLATARAGG